MYEPNNRFITTLIKTICGVFENINVSKNDIVEVFNKEKVNSIKPDEYIKIYQIYQATTGLFLKQEKLSFNDILIVNQIVENQTNINSGDFRKYKTKIKILNETIEIPPQNVLFKIKCFNKLIFKLDKEKKIDTKINLILDFFVEEITEHNFNTKNKTTYFIICNKLLLDYCYSKQEFYSLFLNQDDFDKNLISFYLEKYHKPYPTHWVVKPKKTTYKQILIDSIKNNNQQKDIKFTFNENEWLKHQNQIIQQFGISENELISLTS